MTVSFIIISCLLLEKEREVKRNKKLHVSQQPFPYLGGQKNRTERKNKEKSHKLAEKSVSRKKKVKGKCACCFGSKFVL